MIYRIVIILGIAKNENTIIRLTIPYRTNNTRSMNIMKTSCKELNSNGKIDNRNRHRKICSQINLVCVFVRTTHLFLPKDLHSFFSNTLYMALI